MASLVIKVTYEEMLRRFYVSVIGDQKLDLSMEGLRLKISSLFNIPADAKFELTYKDEDGDLVTLVDDDDLSDIIKQRLNPVRITVHLDSTQGTQSTSAPSSPFSQDVQPNANVAEALKSLQEPLTRVLLNLRSVTPISEQNPNPDTRKMLKSVQAPLAQSLTKLSSDISSKAASTSPILADLFDGLSKMGQLCMNAALSNSGNAGNVVTKNGGDGVDTPVPTQSVPKNTQPCGLSVSVEDNSGSCESAFKKMSSSATNKNRHLTAGESCGGMDAPEKKSCSRSIIHKNIGCDGCGVLPINGPRFKSKVKYNYDLCRVCFLQIGSGLDYTRIDTPLVCRRTRSTNSPNAKCPYLSGPRLYVPKHLHMGFDSRFIMDVNVMDGTTMAPSTPFTKIWRMQNSGSVPWTRGLQFLWIGGDRFSLSDSVEIQVPLTAVDVASEINVSVNFIAPDSPGQYISYWMMAGPSGHRFGQRVWVQIQVDRSLDLTRESSPMLNLNLPSESNKTAFPHVVDVKVEHESGVEVRESSAPPILQMNNNTDQMLRPNLNFPINDDLLVSNAASDKPVSPIALSPVSYPTPPASAPVISYPTSDGNHNIHEQVTEGTFVGVPEIEDLLLKELEQMGFKQTHLNKEVLRVNKYDLERSVDDLCDVFEWDPILEELQDMGFNDKETNKKLLAKNNGSISHVVMDLIAKG